MLWLRCAVLVVCFSTLGTAVSLQQCGSQGLVTVSPNRPYNVTCPHDDTTFNVTWLFTSLMDPPTNYVITQDCLLFSRSSEAYCQSEVPAFRVVRPRYGYTSLEVDWGHLSGAMTFGRVTCLLDGVTSGACFLRLLVEETTSPPPSPSSPPSPSTVRSTILLTPAQPELPLTSSSPSSSSPVSSASPSSAPTTDTAASQKPPTTSLPTSKMTNSQKTGMASGGLPTTATTTSATATSAPRDVSSSFTSPTMLYSTLKSSRPEEATESSSSTHLPATTTTTTPSGDVRSRSPSTRPTTTADTRESSHTERVVVIAVVVAIVAGIPALAVGIIVCCLWRKRRQRFRSRSIDEGRLQFANTLEDTRRDSYPPYPPSTKK